MWHDLNAWFDVHSSGLTAFAALIAALVSALNWAGTWWSHSAIARQLDGVKRKLDHLHNGKS